MPWTICSKGIDLRRKIEGKTRMAQPTNIILIGFATSGKTTVGKLLAEKLAMRFVDTDNVVEQIARATVKQIFVEQGEARFRDLENGVIRSLSTACGTVISCGGGSVLCTSFETLASTGRVVWLQVSSATVFGRLRDGRPLFDGMSERQLSDILSERATLYRKFAQFTLCTDGLTSTEAAQRLTEML